MCTQSLLAGAQAERPAKKQKLSLGSALDGGARLESLSARALQRSDPIQRDPRLTSLLDNTVAIKPNEQRLSLFTDQGVGSKQLPRPLLHARMCSCFLRWCTCRETRVVQGGLSLRINAWHHRRLGEFVTERSTHSAVLCAGCSRPSRPRSGSTARFHTSP